MSDFDGDDLVAAIFGEAAEASTGQAERPAGSAARPAAATPVPDSPAVDPARPVLSGAPEASPPTTGTTPVVPIAAEGPGRTRLTDAQRAVLVVVAVIVVIALIGAAAMAARSEGPVPCRGDGFGTERGLFDGC